MEQSIASNGKSAQSLDKKYSTALELKKEGNEFYKIENYKKAIRYYYK